MGTNMDKHGNLCEPQTLFQTFYQKSFNFEMNEPEVQKYKIIPRF